MQPVKISGLLTVKLVVFAGSSAAAAAGVRALGLSSEPEQRAFFLPADIGIETCNERGRLTQTRGQRSLGFTASQLRRSLTLELDVFVGGA